MKLYRVPILSMLAILPAFPQPASADSRGAAFCIKLLSAMTPEHGAIYYEDRESKIVRLQNGQSLQRRAGLNFFYFRNRSDVPNTQAGAINIKIVYAIKDNRTLNLVNLYNNIRDVDDRCKTVSIETYERFHGESRQRNTCIRETFHQGRREQFGTLEPSGRRREFLFGAPGIDTRGFDAAALGIATRLFRGDYAPEHWKDMGPQNQPAASGSSYRSSILNYSGQDKGGSCIRFAPVIQPNYTTATFWVTDLIEEEGVFPMISVSNVAIAD